MQKSVLLFILIVVYGIVILPFTTELSKRPIAVKLGFFPNAEIVKLVVGDQQYIVSEYATLKVIMYFGSLVEHLKNKVYIQPEYENMIGTLKTASKLDPWNADIYYFSQAAFVWELRKVSDVNSLLDYGIRHRTWDDQLPFFAGFNAAYFLKDYAAAAEYMKRAAEISKNPLVTNLAARYFYESGQEEVGIKVIEYIQQRTMDVRLSRLYLLRKEALTAVLTIKQAISKYTQKFNTSPHSVDELLSSGMLDSLPVDPYGGSFYIDKHGTVRSTSKFSMPGVASPIVNQKQ